MGQMMSVRPDVLPEVALSELKLLQDSVKPFDSATAIKQIESAILQSPLGITPQNDGTIIRLPMPPLTEQRRKDLVKITKGHGEDAKVAIRKARHECRDMLGEIKTEGGASEDDVERGMKKLEEIVQEGVAKVEEILAVKEKDIMTL